MVMVLWCVGLLLLESGVGRGSRGPGSLWPLRESARVVRRRGLMAHGPISDAGVGAAGGGERRALHDPIGLTIVLQHNSKNAVRIEWWRYTWKLSWTSIHVSYTLKIAWQHGTKLITGGKSKE
eukprot:scaffold107081_cov46-Tisochrysis_lutea.AAC.1